MNANVHTTWWEQVTQSALFVLLTVSAIAFNVITAVITGRVIAAL